MFDGKTCHVCTQLEHVFFVDATVGTMVYLSILLIIISANPKEQFLTLVVSKLFYMYCSDRKQKLRIQNQGYCQRYDAVTQMARIINYPFLICLVDLLESHKSF